MIRTHRIGRRMRSAAAAAWMMLLTASSVILLSSHVGMIAHAASASVRGTDVDGGFYDDAAFGHAADNNMTYPSKMCREAFLKDRKTSAPVARRVAAENEAVERTWWEWDSGRRGEGGRKTTVPCDEDTGLANGLYPCKLVDLESHVPLSELQPSGAGEEGSDGWGWASPSSGKEYALVTLGGLTTTRTTFVEVSDRSNPLVVGWLPSHNNGESWWLDVKTYANHAYIVNEAAGTGMQVFDLTQLDDVTENEMPKTFEETKHYDKISQSHNIFINEESGYAYVVGANGDGTTNCAGGLHIIDVGTEPSNPEFVACYSDDGYTHDVQCVNYDGPDANYVGQEICFACNGDTVTIIDVTDKTDMVELSKTGYDHHYTHQGWLTEDRKYFIFGDEQDEKKSGVGTRTFVLDVTDLGVPAIVRELTSVTADAIDHNQYVMGKFSYQANYRAGLRVLNVAEIGVGGDGAPDEVGYFDTYPPEDDAKFNGAWSVYPYFSDTVLIFGIEQGLMVLTPHCSIYGDGSCVADSPTASPAPSSMPTIDPPGEIEKELTTLFDGDVQESGNMFDVVAGEQDIHVLGLDVHTAATGQIVAEVYTRAGSWRGHHDKADHWTLVMGPTTLSGNREDAATPLGDLDSPVTVPAGDRQAFYVTLTNREKLMYTISDRVGATFMENSDLIIQVGCGKVYPFGTMYSPRGWNGVLRYSLTNEREVDEGRPAAPLYEIEDGLKPTPEITELRERSRQHVDLDLEV